MTTPAARVKRLCDVCGELDSDPKHVTGVPPGFPGAVPSDEFLDSLPDGTPPRAVAELMDPGTIIRHQHCCASRGCEICKQTEATHGGLRGDELLAHIQDGGVDHLSDSKEVAE